MISKWWKRKWDWQSPPIETDRSKLSQREFETEFYEHVASRQPDYWEALAALANHYTAQRRFRDGLEVDRKLARIRPEDPVIHYNLACSYSLLGDLSSAFESLERALSLGYRDFRHMMHDSDLDAVRADGRFVRLLSRYITA